MMRVMWHEVDANGNDVYEPAWCITSALPDLNNIPIPIHDHRDNFNGGLAFAIFHPETALPKMPWAA
jgi:hypothetical protein